jgi:DNA modification methylase
MGVGDRPSPGTVEVWSGHALDLIDSIESIDLLCTDPPYAMGGEGAEHAVSATVATVLRESGRRVKRGHWAVVFCASSWRSIAYTVEAMRGVMEPVRIGTWVKPVAKSKVRTAGWTWSSVNVIAFRRGPKNAAGVPSDVLDWIQEPPLLVGRRAQLPERVAAWAVNPFAVPGGLAVDPFSGSGALPHAAARAGMAALGFEMEGSEASWLDHLTTDVPRPA